MKTYAILNKAPRLIISGHVARIGKRRNSYRILIALGRRRRKWEANIRMDLRDIGWEVVDWIHLAEDRDQWWAVLYTVVILQDP